jgi:serine/threonine-protein kinase
VQPAWWNVPVPVDPGDYAITASAPGRETWSGSVTVPEKAASASITVPPLRKSPDAEQTAPSTEGATAAEAGTVQPVPPSSLASSSDSGTEAKGARQRTVAYVVGAAGIAGVAVGSFFGVRAITKNHDAESHCPRGYQCDSSEGVTLSNDAKSAARISNVAFAVGGAALVGCAVLYFTAPVSKPAEASAAILRARVGLTGVVVEGSF